jgi:hypothetical protein
VRGDADGFLSAAASQREHRLTGITLCHGGQHHGKPKQTHVSGKILYKTSYKPVRDELHVEKDLSDQIGQAFNDTTFTAVVGEGEDGFNETGSGAVQEISERNRGRAGEEVGFA